MQSVKKLKLKTKKIIRKTMYTVLTPLYKRINMLKLKDHLDLDINQPLMLLPI